MNIEGLLRCGALSRLGRETLGQDLSSAQLHTWSTNPRAWQQQPGSRWWRRAVKYCGIGL